VEDSTPIGLSSVAGVVFSSCCSSGGGGGGGGVVDTIDGGGGGGQTSDPSLVDSWLASLNPDLGARVPVGLPRGPIWILTVCMYAGFGTELSTSITSTWSSSSSSSATATSSSPCY
jgi:hypothetical protein